MLIEKYCKDLQIKLAFTSLKIKNLITTKDCVPIVYKCTHMYIYAQIYIKYTNLLVQNVILCMFVKQANTYPLGYASFHLVIRAPMFISI